MKIEIGLTANSGIEKKPSIKIVVDDKIIAENIVLDDCGAVEDPNAHIQKIVFDTQVSDDLPGEHVLRIVDENINDSYKVSGDFGFQVRSIKLDGIDLEWVFKNSTTYNPIPNQDHIDSYLIPNNRQHEIQTINGREMHVVHGDYANYVNMSGGWFELKFCTPIYQWLLKQNFGYITRSLVMIFDADGAKPVII